MAAPKTLIATPTKKKSTYRYAAIDGSTTKTAARPHEVKKIVEITVNCRQLKNVSGCLNYEK